MPASTVGSEIIVAGQRFDIGHPVRTFMDAGGYDAYLERRTDDPSQAFPTHPAAGMEKRTARYRERRLLGRDRTLPALRRVARQVVVHLDGCFSARMCFHVLHNQHGLSVHFMVDNDGVIYQTLDLVDCAFHAAGVNETSIGIELQNRGDAARFPKAYDEERPTVTCAVHGTQFLAYDFTAPQYTAMIHLGRALSRILSIPLAVPRASSGEAIWTAIPDPRRFEGFIGHYHLTTQKWDPGPWDFARMFRNIGNKATFPLTAIDPARTESLEADAEAYHDAVERDAGAYFPVGPVGESRLWHGGVHLPGKADGPIFAPIRGRIVAARIGGPCAIGSCNFVLIEHRLETESRSLPFFSLYFHVRAETLGASGIDWLSKRPDALAVLSAGRTALLDVLVDAGELIAHVGDAGPAGARSPQVHFAIFAAEELGAVADPGYWEVVLGTETNRFCRNREIIERIDRSEGGEPRDGLLSRREIARFFRSDPRRADFRRMVVRHLSEWTPGDWLGALEQAPDFASLPQPERRRLVSEQIEPTLWWTRAVAEHAGLPADGVVYSYHPIGFLVWYDEVSRKKANLRALAIATARPDLQVAGTGRFELDFESTTHMTDHEDLLAGGEGQKLTLEELVDGYPD